MKLLNVLLDAAPASGGSNKLLLFLIAIIVIAIIIYFSTRKKNILASDNSASRNSRYPALKTIAAMYKTFAFIIGLVAGITAAYFLTESTIAILPAVIALVVGVLLVLALLAVSESILVFMDIEQNTRETAMNSKK